MVRIHVTIGEHHFNDGLTGNSRSFIRANNVVADYFRAPKDVCIQERNPKRCSQREHCSVKTENMVYCDTTSFALRG